MGKPTTFETAVDIVLAELKDVLVRKQRQYGHGNILSFGQLGVMVRLSDKMERIKNLWNTKRKPEDESVIDSYIDLANYAIIWLMLSRGIFDLPLENHGAIKSQGTSDG